jgi:imidazolonepropionase-like amidohydrolase
VGQAVLNPGARGRLFSFLASLVATSLVLTGVAFAVVVVIDVVVLTARPPVAEPEVCLVGAQVLDPERRSIGRADVVLSGERIVRVGPGAGAHCHGERVELPGRTIMPGLIDTHVHGWGNPSPIGADADAAGDVEEDIGNEAVLALVLRAGVMATLDLAGNDQQRIAVRDRLRPSRDHAALFVGAPIMARDPAAQPEAQRAQVRQKAARKPDFIKIIANGGVIAPLVEEARRLGLPTVVHIGSWDDARRAVAAGATAITHFEDEVQVPEELAAAWGEARIWSIPTLAVQCDLGEIAAVPALLDDPLLAEVTGPSLRAAYRQRASFTKKARDWVRWQTDGCVSNDFVSLRRLHARGVRFLAGSDTGNLGTFQGFSLHRELELAARAGLPPWETLQSATTSAAAFLGIPWGIKVGAPANLIVLKASPLEDMRNTRKIDRVIHRGKRVALP